MVTSAQRFGPGTVQAFPWTAEIRSRIITLVKGLENRQPGFLLKPAWSLRPKGRGRLQGTCIGYARGD